MCRQYTDGPLASVNENRALESPLYGYNGGVRQEADITLERLQQLLQRVQQGDLSVPSALDELRDLPYQDLGFAQVDHHRPLRTGFPEVVFGQGKTPRQIGAIAETVTSRSGCVLVTRASVAAYRDVKRRLSDARYDRTARVITVDRRPERALKPGVLVVAAGTSDLPVAAEAAVTAEMLGSQVERLTDVGIAGVHRLLDRLPTLRQARVLVVVAGMEGALPSLVAGLVEAPVIAVPTSVGYGANFEGLTPLLAMLNSCAPGIAVVNVDNGFGAGYLAGVINRMGA